MKCYAAVFAASLPVALASNLPYDTAGASGDSCNKQANPYLWVPAVAGDVRGPCPMLNSLANHFFLPHDGKDITKGQMRCALGNALSVNETLSDIIFSSALTTNPTPNATIFSLNHLCRHNVLEHDASLSRQDAYYGDACKFNADVFHKTTSFWPDDSITLQQAETARRARVAESAANNPNSSMSELGSSFGVGEVAALFMFFPDEAANTIDKSMIEPFFENEWLPAWLGWRRPARPVVFEDLMDMMNRVSGSLNDTTNSTVSARSMPKRYMGPHSWF